MEWLESLFNAIGVVPADWYTQMDQVQKNAFITITAIAVVFAVGFFALLVASRKRVKEVSENQPDRKLEREIAQDIHDKVLFDWLCKKKLNPKQYKHFCRMLNPAFPGLLPYGWKAKQHMREQRLKIAIANRLLNGEHKPSGITTFLQTVRVYLLTARTPTVK